MIDLELNEELIPLDYRKSVRSDKGLNVENLSENVSGLLIESKIYFNKLFSTGISPLQLSRKCQRYKVQSRAFKHM